LREHLAVDLVGLDLRAGDRPRAHRVRHRRAARVLSEQFGDRPRHRGRLQDHVVARAQRLRERPQLAGLDPPSRRNPPSSCTATSAKRLCTSSATVLTTITTNLLDADDNDRAEAGQHDTYGSAPAGRNRTRRKGVQTSARAHTGPYAGRPAVSRSPPLPQFRSHLLRDRGQRPLFHNRYQPDRASRTAPPDPHPPSRPPTTNKRQRAKPG
jgi:hypothetical protein